MSPRWDLELVDLIAWARNGHQKREVGAALQQKKNFISILLTRITATDVQQRNRKPSTR